LFTTILEETLEELHMEYRDTNDYLECEINLITNVILGKHLKITCQTLCKECHKSLHKNEKNNLCCNDKHKQYYNIYYKTKEIKRNKQIEEELIPYLESNINSVLLKLCDRRELIGKINIKDSHGRLQKSRQYLNDGLQDLNLNYKIIQFETSRVINGEKIKYKNAWKIIKTA